MAVAQPNAQTGATGYPPNATPSTVLSMLRVQPPFAWRLQLLGRKRARIEFVAATWEVDVETQAGERTPAFRISFPCAVNMAGVQLKDGEQLVGLYAYRLRGGGGGALETGDGGSGEAGGGRRTIGSARGDADHRDEGWGDRMEAHMDHAWLMMRSHAQGETRVHSGELGVVEVGGDDNKGGDDDARSHNSAGSGGSKGKGVGPPRKAQRTPPPPPSPLSPLSPPLPKWQIGCSSSRPSPSGRSGL